MCESKRTWIRRLWSVCNDTERTLCKCNRLQLTYACETLSVLSDTKNVLFREYEYCEYAERQDEKVFEEILEMVSGSPCKMQLVNAFY